MRTTAVLVAVLALAPVALAAPTYTVSETTDGAGSCNPTTFQCTTLRAAVAAADQPADAGATISLGAHTYTLNAGATCLTTLGELKITQSMTIDGAGQGGSAGTTIQQADNCSRVFEIYPASATTVAFSGLEITGGDSRDDGSAGVYGGGGILADGDASTTQVTVQNVDVTGNSVTAPSGVSGSGESGEDVYGGGISMGGEHESLTVNDDSVVSSNTATASDGAGGVGLNGGSAGEAAGGGIYVGSEDTLNVSTSTIENNTATGGDAGNASGTHVGGYGGDADGGGIESGGANTMVLDSTLSGNRAVAGTGGNDPGGTGGYGGYGFGGGIEVDNLSKLMGDTVTANRAIGALGGTGASVDGDGGARGGGVSIEGSAVTIDASTLTENVATGSGHNPGTGGGVEVDAGFTGLAIVNSTVFDNTAQPDEADLADSAGAGGGIYTYSPITLASDTVDANQAAGNHGAGGNLYTNISSPIKATDTIIAGGVGDAGDQNCSGTFEDLAPGHNLEDDDTSECGFSTTDGDQVGVFPHLAAALASNGGVTQTLALAATSPARGLGGACINPLVTGNPAQTVDQRGDARPATCDIGAFQSEPPLSTVLPTIAGNAKPGQTLTCAVGTWLGDGLSYTYAWLKNGAAIPTATGASFKVPVTDVRAGLACRVTAAGTYGIAQATSATVTVYLSAPALSRAGESHRSWRASGKASKHKPPIGTKFTFRLNEPATVTLTFEQQAKGRKVKRRCVAPSRKNRHDAGCKLTVKKGTLTVAGRIGANTVSFRGGLAHGHRLKPGKYTVVLSASNTGGHSRSQTLTFTVAKT